tara:strand:- start:5128 stop:5895 length:768 start_codon:yes stop_codon:yes gene_type:complete
MFKIISSKGNSIIKYVPKDIGMLSTIAIVIVAVVSLSPLLSKDENIEDKKIGSVFLHNNSQAPKVGYLQLGAHGLNEDYVKRFEHHVKDVLGRDVRVRHFSENKASKFYGINSTFFQTMDYLVGDDTYYRLSARESKEEGVFYVEHHYSYDDEKRCISTNRELKRSLTEEYGLEKWFETTIGVVEFNVDADNQVFSMIDDTYGVFLGWSCDHLETYDGSRNVTYIRIGILPSRYSERNKHNELSIVSNTMLAHKE